MSKNFFLAIAGNIGTGKTTLTKLLADKYNWQPYFEAANDNPYLDDFYKDMSRWSFPLQVFFLTNRVQVHKKILSDGGAAIQDRSIYEDYHIFARNLHDMGMLEKRDFVNYLALFQEVTAAVRPPDLIIYLRKSTSNLMSQIRNRGRDYEASISENYIARLNNYYEDWISDYELGKKLIIESDELDFVSREADFEKILALIVEVLDNKPSGLKKAVFNS